MWIGRDRSVLLSLTFIPNEPERTQEEVDRLSDMIRKAEQKLSTLKGLNFQSPASPGSPVPLTGLASEASNSPGEAVAGDGGDRRRSDAEAAAHGADVLFSLPGGRR